MKIDDSLVNFHFVAIPRLGAFAARRLARRDLEKFRRHSHGTFHSQLLVFGAANQIGANWTVQFSSVQFTRDEIEKVAIATFILPFSKLFTFLLVKVMRMRWIGGSSIPFVSLNG